MRLPSPQPNCCCQSKSKRDCRKCKTSSRVRAKLLLRDPGGGGEGLEVTHPPTRHSTHPPVSTSLGGGGIPLLGWPTLAVMTKMKQSETSGACQPLTLTHKHTGTTGNGTHVLTIIRP